MGRNAPTECRVLEESANALENALARGVRRKFAPTKTALGDRLGTDETAPRPSKCASSSGKKHWVTPARLSSRASFTTRAQIGGDGTSSKSGKAVKRF